MIKKVMRAPINLFYDTTPIGQIQNRFGKDLDGCRRIIDVIGNLGMDFIRLFTIISVLAAANWQIIILVPFMLAGSIILYKFIMPVYLQAERVMSIVRSPVLNNLNECISGCSTIRAFGTQQRFKDLQYELQHKELLCRETLEGMWNWFHLRNNFIAMIVMISSCTGCLIVRETQDPVILAMLLTYIIQLTWTFDCIMGNSQWIERQMVHLRRCFAILEIDQERDEEARVPISKTWPKRGRVTFEDVEMRYRPDTPQVLKGLSFDIEAGHKVGVVGRTGAGKSSVSVCLTRIVEIEAGKIRIDGINIHKLPIDKAREVITIIPQDPTLFNGTLRFNLDPEGNCSDNEILSLLRRAGCTELLSRESQFASEDKPLTNALDIELTENGSNLSSGEKQLLCICRAILRRNRIVILDEATANIDLVTEQKIQEVISTEFKDCTVITIAHRLQTIIDNDRVMVLGDGQLVEYDTPAKLLENPDSHFTKLVEEL